jgi:hypothetical protein
MDKCAFIACTRSHAQGRFVALARVQFGAGTNERHI